MSICKLASHTSVDVLSKVCLDARDTYCEPVLQSSTQQWGIHFAKTSTAEHWWWITAHMHEHQIFTAVFAMTQACCPPGLQSSTKQ